eukprot:3734440-Rhodomonas_salina.1
MKEEGRGEADRTREGRGGTGKGGSGRGGAWVQFASTGGGAAHGSRESRRNGSNGSASTPTPTPTSPQTQRSTQNQPRAWTQRGRARSDPRDDAASERQQRQVQLPFHAAACTPTRRHDAHHDALASGPLSPDEEEDAEDDRRGARTKAADEIQATDTVSAPAGLVPSRNQRGKDRARN